MKNSNKSQIKNALRVWIFHSQFQIVFLTNEVSFNYVIITVM